MTTDSRTPDGVRVGAPTVKEVALRAGVSPMTVSRTLAGGKNVRLEVQQRVFDAVAALGYRRNENARSLRPGHTSGLLGLAITNLSNPYYGMLADGAERYAARFGRRIQLGSTSEAPSLERELISDFVGRQVEGLIVVPADSDAEHLRAAAALGIPVVLASRSLEGFEVDAVLVDDVGGARAATTELLRRGHRRIAFLGPGTSVFTARRRYEGYVEALRAFGVHPDHRLARHGQQDVESALRGADELLDLETPPTAFFGANNRNAIGALQAVLRRRTGAWRSAPAVISFDDFELSELVPTPFVVVSHDPRELGRAATEMLFDRMSGVTGAPRVEELPAEVHVRNLVDL